MDIPLTRHEHLLTLLTQFTRSTRLTAPCNNCNSCKRVLQLLQVLQLVIRFIWRYGEPLQSPLSTLYTGYTRYAVVYTIEVILQEVL